MSRTYKDQDLTRYAPSARQAWERVRTDRAFAALLGFYTGLDEHGNEVTEAKAVLDHVANALTRGQ